MSDTLGFVIILVCALIVSAWGAWKLSGLERRK